MRILTHNVGRHLASFEALDDLLISSAADVVCLQEVPLSYVEQRFPRLAAHHPHQVHTCRRTTDGMGMALLSKWSMGEWQTVRLAAEGLELQQRVLLHHADEGGRLIVYNIHLTYPWIRRRRLGLWPHLKCVFRRDHFNGRLVAWSTRYAVG